MNRFFWILTLWTTFHSLFICPSFSEPSEHDSDVEKGVEGTKKRPPVTDRLSEEELDFLTQRFFRAEDSVSQRFDNTKNHPELFLPEGITAVQKEPFNETTVAKALAELSGSLNEKQLENLEIESRKLAGTIRNQDPKDRDSRLLVLVERSEWLSFILKGETPPSESLPQAKDERAFNAFKKEFLGALKEVNNKNKEILALIEEAKNGNETAKKTLRQKLDMKSMPDFLKAQNAFDGKALFEKTAEALAHIDKEGHRYHDFRDKDGKLARVVAGKTASEHVNQLSDFLRNNPERLSGYSLVARPIASGRPELINLTGKPLPPPKPNTEGDSSSPGRITLAQAAKPIFVSKCVTCHKSLGVDPLEDFALAAERIKDGSMPQSPTVLTQEEKNALLRFFLSAEPKTEFTNLTR